MIVLQVPPTSLIDKMVTKDPCKPTLYMYPFFSYLWWRKNLLRQKKTGRSDLSPEGTDGMSLHLGVRQHKDILTKDEVIKQSISE